MIEKFKSILKEIESKRIEFENSLTNGEDKIEEKCLEIRNDVQLATDSAILRINELSDKLLEEIDDYKEECLDSYEMDDLSKEKFSHFIEELDQFHDQWIQYVKKIKVTDDEILRATQLANALNKKILSQEKKLNLLLFNKKLIKFVKKNIDENSLGKISFEKPEIIDYDDLKLVNIREIFEDLRPNTIHVSEMKDGNLYILYKSTSDNLKCVTASKDGKLVSTCKLYSHDLQSFRIQNDIVVASTFAGGYYFVKILNLKLDSIHSVNIFKKVSSFHNYPATCVCANETNVYYLTSHATPLIIFNRQLGFVNKIGQLLNPNEAFYFPVGIKQLECRNGHYYWINEKKFQILNQKDGFTIKLIFIVTDQFEIISNNNVVILDQSTKKIIYLSKQGVQLREIDLIDFNFDPLFFSDNLGRFNFFDKKKLDLVLYN